MMAHAVRQTARSLVFLFALLSVFVTTSGAAPPSDAEWIWTARHEQGRVPDGECFFRKTFRTEAFEYGQIDITCDDQYELFVNGRRVGSGDNWKRLDSYDISRYLVEGRNVLAVRAVKKGDDVAGLVARVIVKQRGGTHVAESTDSTWKTSLKPSPHWYKPSLDDSRWIAAQSLGVLGQARPWGKQVQAEDGRGRFRVMKGFRVEWIVSPEETGSLLAMTFNEFGQILASRENGPLLLIVDEDKDGVHETIKTYCDEVSNCQGILALNGDVFVTADGPDGAALYRLSDDDRDGIADSVRSLIRFQGKMGEHGAHGLTLGRDGLIYLIAGNHAKLDETHQKYAKSSPFRDYHPGDLLKPRYEDPKGHAAGIVVPGGMILRTGIDGENVELFAGGLRNAYDLAIDNEGELFTFDSDMESNRGTPWYRPTRLSHVMPGAELGWRSGWAKFPPYFLDALPATFYMGRGSPTGMVFYNHFNYPNRFHNSLFTCDWSRGKIDVLRMRKQGGSYRIDSKTFVEGRPLNVTDAAVGPDGWLYFCTGGRGTEGGIYCVTWLGKVPPAVSDLGQGIDRALHFPQLNSSWARQAISKVKQIIGDRWDSELLAVARDEKRTDAERVRSLDLMQLMGPSPTIELLLELSTDESESVRKKAAFLLGIHTSESGGQRLVELLADRRPVVQRQACESLVRSDYHAPAEKIIPLLADPDRQVAYAAMRALQNLPAEEWREAVLASQDLRIFLNGSAALLATDAGPEFARRVLRRAERIIGGYFQEEGRPPGFVSDTDFTELMRVIQIALMRGKIGGDEVPRLRARLADEYPSRDPLMNRELVRLLVYLQEPAITGRMIQQLRSEIDPIEKVFIASHAPFLKTGWTTRQKLSLFAYYARARKEPDGGNRLEPFMDRFSRDFAANLEESEFLVVLKNGAQWPNAAVAILNKLPQKPSKRILGELMRLDSKLDAIDGEATRRLQTGIVAIFGRSGDPRAMEYLRAIFDADPERRMIVTAGLAQSPDGPNWPLLVRSLPIVEGLYAREIMKKLASVDRKPDDPEALRQVILAGLRLQNEGKKEASRLLVHWTGERLHNENDRPEEALSKWQTWFAKTYPEKPLAELPAEPEASKWTYNQLLEYLSSSDRGKGNPEHGAIVYERAQCAKCHQYGVSGESLGPDLTSVSQRFQMKEILQSVVYPSHVISDQYASKKILTEDGRTLIGIVAQDGEDYVVLPSTGEKVRIPKNEVEVIAPSRVSSMPEGLLDVLTLEEIADMFEFLDTPPRTNITSRRERSSR